MDNLFVGIFGGILDPLVYKLRLSSAGPHNITTWLLIRLLSSEHWEPPLWWQAGPLHLYQGCPHSASMLAPISPFCQSPMRRNLRYPLPAGHTHSTGSRSASGLSAAIRYIYTLVVQSSCVFVTEWHGIQDARFYWHLSVRFNSEFSGL